MYIKNTIILLASKIIYYITKYFMDIHNCIYQYPEYQSDDGAYNDVSSHRIQGVSFLNLLQSLVTFQYLNGQRHPVMLRILRVQEGQLASVILHHPTVVVNPYHVDGSNSQPAHG